MKSLVSIITISSPPDRKDWKGYRTPRENNYDWMGKIYEIPMKYPEKEKVRDMCFHDATGFYASGNHEHARGARACKKCGYCSYCEKWLGKGNY